jgi:hypothetical protein
MQVLLLLLVMQTLMLLLVVVLSSLLLLMMMMLVPAMASHAGPLPWCCQGQCGRVTYMMQVRCWA